MKKREREQEFRYPDPPIRLRWPVEERPNPRNYFEVVTDPIHKKHTILVPPQPREIERLHELCHAWLAENVHHQFSSHHFAPGTPSGVMEACSEALRAATDWFVDEMVYHYLPEEEGNEVREHLEYVEAVGELRERMPIASALIYAQAVRYLHFPTSRIPPGMKPMVQAFLDTPPRPPDVRRWLRLVNRLLALSGRRFRLGLRPTPEGLEVLTQLKRGKRR